MNFMYKIIILAAALLCILSPPVLSANGSVPVKTHPAILGTSIMQNPSFEEWTGGKPVHWDIESTGGTCSIDESISLHGVRSLKLHIPKGKASIIARSKPLPVRAGELYYIRFAYRGEGLSSTQTYAGVQMCVYLVWRNQVGSFYRIDYVDFSYFPMEWGYRDRIYKVPEGSTEVYAVASLEGDQNSVIELTAWFDDLAIYRYEAPSVSDKVTREWSVSAGKELLKVPDAVSWFYLAGTDGDETAQGVRVRDAGSTLVSVLHSPHNAAAGYVYHSPYTLEQPPGLYRAYVRLKIPPALELAPGKSACSSALRSSRTIISRKYAIIIR